MGEIIEVCPKCNGSGWRDVYEDCIDCDGDGFLPSGNLCPTCTNGRVLSANDIPCDFCGGDGSKASYDAFIERVRIVKLLKSRYGTEKPVSIADWWTG